MSARGKYTVKNVRHSSAFREPAAASPKLYGTERSHEGVAVFLMESLMRSMTIGVAIFIGASGDFHGCFAG